MNVNKGKVSEVSKRLNVNDKSYADVVGDNEVVGQRVAENQKMSGVAENGVGNGGVVVEDSTNVTAESAMHTSSSVSETTTKNDNLLPKSPGTNSPDVVVDNTRNESNNKQSSYAQKLLENTKEIGNKLFFVPTVVNGKGDEVVIFDDEMVKEGSEKWKLTVCGYFVGCKMPVYELKYHLRRMWGKHGLKDIVVDNDEICYFKFKEVIGMNAVLDQSPWLVNGKPLVVQKWDPDVVIVKETPCKIPVWVRLFNVPLEAWSIKGISSISSRLGRPIMMDKMTAEMCNEGSGRLGYARVLVEISADKEYANSVEINYVDSELNNKEEVEDNGKNKQMRGDAGNKDGFNEFRNRKNKGENNGGGYNGQGNKQINRKMNYPVRYAYQPKEKGPQVTSTEKRVNTEQLSSNGSNVNSDGESNKGKEKVVNPSVSESPPSLEKVWKVSSENLKELKKSANKYSILSEMNDQGELKEHNGKVASDEEDVYENRNKANTNVIANEILVEWLEWVWWRC
ncbi:hypothetical protein CTI12_AA287770 [Artemisia annua]|uniref:DUF4283 domain-containing protein n=1 Tax=Artemisia annua TaxID=35608 RepID=A0A2U1NAF8_ARTAN|nr:hypothetical protein CTI12_AA287770 [Artemisia annua]